MEACIVNIQKFCIHDGPGIRTTVFFKGCPLGCLWCSNPESQETGISPNCEPHLAGRVYSLDEVVKICLDDKVFYDESGGGVTLSGGEPLMQPEFAVQLLNRLSKLGIHTALETSGFSQSDVFKEVIAHTDYLLFDLKHHDNEKHIEGTKEELEPILHNLELAVKSGIKTLVRIPIIPNYNDSLEDAQGFAKLLRKHKSLETQLLPFHQLGQKKYESLNIPYYYEKQKTLYPEDLEPFIKEMKKSEIQCFV